VVDLERRAQKVIAINKQVRSGTDCPDCLFLDLYIPSKQLQPGAAKLPILYWIYGGACKRLRSLAMLFSSHIVQTSSAVKTVQTEFHLSSLQMATSSSWLQTIVYASRLPLLVSVADQLRSSALLVGWQALLWRGTALQMQHYTISVPCFNGFKTTSRS